MSRHDFLRKLEELLEAEPDSIKGQEQLESIGWNSLALVGFIAMADEECGIAVSPAKLWKCETPEDLMALLGDKIVSAAA